MHQVFRISELLHEIFSYSSNRTNVITARVCQLWFTHSIPFIWDTVWLNDALKVLSPFTDGLDDGFQEPLSPGSWRRFLLYSKHVRQLRCFETPDNALRQAALWRPCADLFPSKLTVLQWEGQSKIIEYLPPLLTSTLQILHIDLDITNSNTLDVLYRTLLARSPSLRVFELNFPPRPVHNDHDTQAISQSLSRVFLLLSKLVKIAIPIHFMTRELSTALSLLPRLQILQFHSHWYLDVENEIHVSDELPKQEIADEEEAEEYLPFCSLKNLEVFSQFRHSQELFTIGQILAHSPQLLKLTEFYYSFNQENLNHVTNLIDLIYTVCPNLQKLTLSGASDLPWQAIRRLLKCPALVKLTLSPTVNIELEEVIALATNRTSWETIMLPSSKPLSYQALIAFAQNCPNLTDLGLTLDDKLPFPDLNASTKDIKFLSLTFLNVGHSALASGIEVAIFLSRICRTPPKIFKDHRGGYQSSWEAVEKLVSFIITTQLENQTLKNVNALLRTQICNIDI